MLRSKKRDEAPTPTVPLSKVLTGLLQATGTAPQDKVLYFFDLFDRSGDGIMDRVELMELILNTQRMQDTKAADVVKMLSTLDKDGDKKISREEFLVRVGCHNSSLTPVMAKAAPHLISLRFVQCLRRHRYLQCLKHPCYGRPAAVLTHDFDCCHRTEPCVSQQSWRCWKRFST